MEAEKAAALLGSTPERVTLGELDGVRAEEAVGRARRVPLLECSATPLPEGPCLLCPRLAEECDSWRQAGSCKSMHQRAVQREALLKQRVAEREAQRRRREQQLFGTPSAAGAGPSEAAPAARPTPNKPRGPQPGTPGPSRRDHAHLPAVEALLDLPAEEPGCSCWGLPFHPFPGTEDSESLEVEVQAYRRVVHRRRYRPTCSWEAKPGIVTAPPAPRVIPTSIVGTSIWGEVLRDKFLCHRPT